MSDQERDYFQDRAREQLDPFSESSIAETDKIVEDINAHVKGDNQVRDLEALVSALRSENAALKEANEMVALGFVHRLTNRLEQARKAIDEAISNEDGLDGGVGEDLLTLIDDDLRRVKSRLGNAPAPDPLRCAKCGKAREE